jgi:hypothetical protein
MKVIVAGEALGFRDLARPLRRMGSAWAHNPNDACPPGAEAAERRGSREGAARPRWFIKRPNPAHEKKPPRRGVGLTRRFSPGHFMDGPGATETREEPMGFFGCVKEGGRKPPTSGGTATAFSPGCGKGAPGFEQPAGAALVATARINSQD